MSDMFNLNNFKRSLAFTLNWEGGYSNDPSDPGGETKWGISKRNHPDLDIKNLTPQQASDIYQNEYWTRMGCDDIMFPDCVAVFDTAVNCGVGTARYWLRNSPHIEDFIAKRVQSYVDRVNKNPALQKFMGGWMNRVNDLKKYIATNQDA